MTGEELEIHAPDSCLQFAASISTLPSFAPAPAQSEPVGVLFMEVCKFLCRITFCDRAIKVHQLKGIISRKGIRRFMAMLPSLPFAST